MFLVLNTTDVKGDGHCGTQVEVAIKELMIFALIVNLQPTTFCYKAPGFKPTGGLYSGNEFNFFEKLKEQVNLNSILISTNYVACFEALFLVRL